LSWKNRGNDGHPNGSTDEKARVSAFAPPGREFPVKKGETKGTLVFPIPGLPNDADSLKIRLVGTLPGSGYERILLSETLAIKVKERTP
jgi:hypothetical protein